MKKIGVILLMLGISGVVFAGAKPGSYQLPITRDGQTQTKVAYNFWSGEYPRPVIDVRSHIKGTTTVKAYRSLRKLNKPVLCTIKNGLYHPWSKTDASALTYYSLIDSANYRVERNTVLEKTKLSKGSLLARVIYLSEGYCRGNIGKKVIEFECGQLKLPVFKSLNKDTKFHEQWVYLKCQQGYKAFVRDSKLLAQPNIKQGKIAGYGDVASEQARR